MISILFGVWVFVVVGNLIMQLALALSGRYELRMMREEGDDFTVVKKPINFGAIIRFIFVVICPLLNVLLLVNIIINFDDLVEETVNSVVRF